MFNAFDEGTYRAASHPRPLAKPAPKPMQASGPMRKACPVPFRRGLTADEEGRLRKSFQELIQHGYTPNEAGLIYDEVRRILSPDELAEVLQRSL